MSDRFSRRLDRRARRGLAALVALGALGVGTGIGTPAPAAGHPAVHRIVRLIRSDPATLHGTGFAPRTRIAVSLAAGQRWVIHVHTSSTGAFTAVFPTAVDRCTAWTVTATQPGAARLVVHGPKPECAPA